MNQFMDANTAGALLLAFMGLMSVYWLGRQIYLSHFPSRDDKDRYVTHGQFDAFKVEMKHEWEQFRREFKEEMNRSAREIDNDVKELRKYTAESFHRVADAHGLIANRLAWLQGAIGKRAIGIGHEPSDLGHLPEGRD